MRFFKEDAAAFATEPTHALRACFLRHQNACQSLIDLSPGPINRNNGSRFLASAAISWRGAHPHDMLRLTPERKKIFGGQFPMIVATRR